MLICSLTGPLLLSLSPLWQYLQCCVNLHFCPTPSALKSKPKPEQNPSLQDLLQDALSSLWLSLGYTFRNNSMNPSFISTRRFKAVYQGYLVIPSLSLKLYSINPSSLFLTPLLFPAYPCCLQLLALFQAVYFFCFSITGFPDLSHLDLTAPLPEPFSCLSSYSLCSPGNTRHNSVAQENNYFSWPRYLSSFRPISLLRLFTLLLFPVIP